MEILLNYPINLDGLKSLITSQSEQFLVWPDASYPFYDQEWLEKLNYNEGHRSYYCIIEKTIVGHIAVRKTNGEHTMRIVFIVVAPHYRQIGIARFMVGEIERLCRQEKLAEKLSLRVRSYNKIAKTLYEKCGYVVYAVNGTAIDMEKTLA